MSQQNVEVVQRAIGAFNAGTIAATYDWYDPDLEFLEDPELRGPDAIEAFFRRFLDLFDDYSIEIEEIVDAGDKVVLFNRQQAHAKGRGPQLDIRSAWVFAFREGKIARITPYWDRARALEAVGLDEYPNRSGAR
ncbi:MAG: nuclear transport factor 2 family protein [Thermoleophilaceae bacterium]|nr:nuclear transport factor 2 family protein [Thermoleophilaceae bacterium]